MTHTSPDLYSQPEAAEVQGVRYMKDRWSAITHFAGFIGALIGSVILQVKASGDVPLMVCMGIYGACVSMLFLASSSYHFFDLGDKKNQTLRRLDHAAIYVMIAGSYVPIIMHLLDGAWRIGMFLVVGTLAVLGVLFKLLMFNGTGKAGVILYVLMGWVVVIPAHRMFPQLSWDVLIWLIGGGVTYTVGALVYARKWPNPTPAFGFHEVWHLFVLGGAAAHFVFTMLLMDKPYPPF
jgi:hemolysin III